MQVVILAAGLSSRLTKNMSIESKVLLELGCSKSLLERHIDIFRSLGINDITVMLGHAKDAILKKLGHCSFNFIENEAYCTTNSLYSFYLYLQETRGNNDCLVINADIIAPTMLYKLMIAACGNAIAIDSSALLDDESMKIEITGAKQLKFSKCLSVDRAVAENIGFLKFKNSDLKYIKAQSEMLIKDKGKELWMPELLNYIAAFLDFELIDMAGMPWIEVDTLEDYMKAKNQIWPSIIEWERVKKHG